MMNDMIPNFKTYIKESIWSNINKRSEGNSIRKEDNINDLDIDDFYRYIKDRYKGKVEYIDLDTMGGGNGYVLGVDITENIILFYMPKRGHILLSWSKVKIPMPFFDEFTDRFKIENPNAMRRIITEKDGSCTNKTFIDVINFFIEHKETYLKESIWSNINKRSEGNIERKEDDINDLDRDGLFNHIFSLYERTNNKYLLDPYVPNKDYSDSFAIYLFKDDYPHRLWVKFDDDKIDRMYLQALPTECREFYKELHENYNLHITNSFIYIYEKDDTVSNKTCMDVIKLIIENSSRPLLKVKI